MPSVPTPLPSLPSLRRIRPPALNGLLAHGVRSDAGECSHTLPRVNSISKNFAPYVPRVRASSPPAHQPVQVKSARHALVHFDSKRITAAALHRQPSMAPTWSCARADAPPSLRLGPLISAQPARLHAAPPPTSHTTHSLSHLIPVPFIFGCVSAAAVLALFRPLSLPRCSIAASPRLDSGRIGLGMRV